MSRLEMSPQVFAIFNGLITERIGIHYEPGDRELVRDKVALRAVEAGFQSLLDYYYYLRYDDASVAEMDALIDALVVGETYFFRELPQLEVMTSELVGPRVTTGHRPRIWSAACATGEEPLTIAMLLGDLALLGKVEIVASDISHRALSRARAGTFGRRSLRSAVPAFARRFIREAREQIVVGAELLDAIDWRRVNLLDGDAVASLGLFDVIVCRNVLIYFEDETARSVIERLTAALLPGGALLVGISESLLRLGTALECEERSGVFVYRKVAST